MSFVRKIQFIFLMLLALVNLAYAEDNAQQTDKSSHLIQLEINGVIGPATADYIVRNLQKAIDQQAVAVLIVMDTPGGLDISMRQIIKQIIASPIPIISYVAPGGARAASAGTYILYASHIAAMAPATNLGAATPVQFGGFGNNQNNPVKTDKKLKPATDSMSHKMINDASAYIRGLAEMRGRNVQWAEQAVRDAASLSATEALKLNVIDIVANDVNDLLLQLQGRKINVLSKPYLFNTTQTEIQSIKPDWRSNFLAIITNPSMAYILLMIGIYGLVLEFSHPGSVVPGTVGGICLLLALYALQLLPINYAGMGLILFGIALMIVEAFMPSFGILGLGGVVAFVVGSVILMDTDMPGFGVDKGLIAGFALSSATFLIIVLGLLLKARKSPVVSGKEQMLGSIGVVQEDFTGTGRIRIHSENWQASCDQSLHKNERVQVIAISGLILQVLPIKKRENESCL